MNVIKAVTDCYDKLPERDMWVEDLNNDVRKSLNMIAGSLNLPALNQYASEAHFLADVYSRMSEAGSLVSRQQIGGTITQLKTERNNAIAEAERLKNAIKETIEDNLHLADGENCTLIKLKRAISYDS